MWETTELEQEYWDHSLEWPSEDYNEHGLTVVSLADLEESDYEICTTRSECSCNDCLSDQGCPW